MDNFDTLIIDELLVFNLGTALTLQEIVSDELRWWTQCKNSKNHATANNRTLAFRWWNICPITVEWNIDLEEASDEVLATAIKLK